MLAEILPYVVGLLLLGALFQLPHRLRPAGAVAGAFILLLVEPMRDEAGEPLAGPCTALAMLILVGVAVAALSGSWKHLHQS